ncbi:MAG: Mrp/NBP35 family ATP-binding protein [Oscillospiraceae bacterium]
MSEECTHDCSSCGESCNERTEDFDFRVAPHSMSNIKKVIGVVSGKGGVGKSLITSMLAVAMQSKGFKTAVLDADITGPSIPKMFGITEMANGSDLGIIPVKTKTGIDIMSINLLLDDPNAPVIWRGPVIAGTVKQFWSDVIWEDVSYMFVDMPPGTGDVPLTVFQSLPIDGIVIVTSPQELVSMIVGKAVTMAKMMDIPIIGVVENMSYVECPDCGKRIDVYGESKINDVAKEHDIEVLAQLPIDPKIASLCDNGDIESVDFSRLTKAINKIL